MIRFLNQYKIYHKQFTLDKFLKKFLKNIKIKKKEILINFSKFKNIIMKLKWL